jgi:mono/diheme cytochrome c family protein
MKHLSRSIMAVLGALLLGMSGCGFDQFPSYPDSFKYPLRQDPILMQPAAKLGDERYDPDTPGQLPLMHLDDIFKPGNPFQPNAKEIEEKEILRDPTKLSDKDKQELATALESIFGTPAKPMVNAKAAGLESETIAVLKIDDDTLDKGSRQFRVHCLHCHGVSGDGRGPTARWVNPHPRDFRSGLFKFQSVNQLDSKPGDPVPHSNATRPPARADLLRTLRNGLEGTAMPSFGILHDDDLERIVSYVIHLSIRGQVERDLLKDYFSYDKTKKILTFKLDPEDEEAPQSIGAAVKQLTKYIAEKSYRAQSDPKQNTSWLFSQKPELAIKPGVFRTMNDKELAASILRGKQLFTGDEKALGPAAKNANCVSCHTDFGRQAKFRFDEWGTLARPNNFPAGVFRGGRRPVDLYYRIHSGINGSGMANFGSVLKTEEIWDLVNFVSALPYPAMLKEAGVNAN